MFKKSVSFYYFLWFDKFSELLCKRGMGRVEKNCQLDSENVKNELSTQCTYYMEN